jgi:copper chaperone CopZ
VSKLETALRKASGIDEAVVTLDPGQAMVRGTATQEDVRTLIEQSGFQVVTSI